ncbi:hypothetical protein [Tenuifilum thalassicum]|uniref:Uncharacterized protein n=1 Tax=Tenuifilum thalassicum TaxID=2590900 RepID=A0A7D4C7K5_9BACT|nr:hypothetical protein [Tenuifilum thalassicum]QKG79082.1 hypothetical protein FHG85_01980 [Tenuifilum thalassicum]
MRRLLIGLSVTFLALAMVLPASAQNRRERKILWNSQYNYEIEPVGVGQDGTKVFKVWGYGKKVNDAVMNAKQAAVAACIFKGLPGGAGSAPTPPICSQPNAEQIHADYFEKFFEVGGKYLQFIALTNDGEPAGADRIKMRKGYKVAIYVQVMYDALRKQLENDGIARRLDAGF